MTLAPILWLLAFFPALVALYFLKLKRREVVVSSTLLWKRTLEDFRVNAPFQRLRRNWLLLLQLLILAALVFAAWRPKVAGEKSGGRDIILLLDNSASTAAGEGAGTRLALAREEARAILRGMHDSDRMTLLAFSSKTLPLGQSTSDKSLLEARLSAVESVPLPTDIDGALRVARSIAEALPSSAVYVVGDGSYGDLSGLPPEVKRLPIKFVSKGSELANLAITEADVRRSFEADVRTEIFALVENFGPAPVRTVVSLSEGGQLRDAREVEVPAGGAAPVVFDATEIREGTCRVFLESKDALEVDNVAWVHVPAPKAVTVLQVGKANPFIDTALDSISGVSRRKMSLGELESALASGAAEEKLGADVIIFDREAPGGEPPLPAMYVSCLPALPDALKGPETRKLPVVVDWDRSHPINWYLVYADLYIEESRVFRDSREYRSLVDSDGGSILGILSFQAAERKPVPAILVGFDILKTNWPIGHYSFVIFFSNAVSWLAEGAGGPAPVRWRTGEALTHVLKPGEKPSDFDGAFFRAPSGKEHRALVEEGGRVVLSSAEEVGVFELVAGGTTRARFCVSLLDRRESRLIPSRTVDLGDFTLQTQASAGEEGRDLWKWFVAAALAILLLEWHVYSRRLG